MHANKKRLYQFHYEKPQDPSPLSLSPLLQGPELCPILYQYQTISYQFCYWKIALIIILQKKT